MTLPYKITARGQFVIDQTVRVTKRFKKVYPKSKADQGTIQNFCNGTELRVKFSELKGTTLIDERFIEPVARKDTVNE